MEWIHNFGTKNVLSKEGEKSFFFILHSKVCVLKEFFLHREFTVLTWIRFPVFTYRALTAATSKDLKRYYFGTLRINTSRITLSVLSSSDLPQDLLAVKRSMGIPLVKFEEAKVELGRILRLLKRVDMN